MKDFISLDKKTKAEVILETIKELGRETELPLRVVVALYANTKCWSSKRIKQYLEVSSQPLILQQIAYYEDDSPVYTHTLNKRCYEILKDKISGIVESSPFMTPASFLKRILKDYAEEIQF